MSDGIESFVLEQYCIFCTSVIILSFFMTKIINLIDSKISFPATHMMSCPYDELISECSILSSTLIGCSNTIYCFQLSSTVN